MTLVEKIKEAYPELANDTFDGTSGIVLKDDLDGYGAYIGEWNHSTIVKPTQAELSILREYALAVKRLAQYQVALGQEEQTEEVVIGQQLDEETEEMVDITETRIILGAIDPVEATVENTTYDDDGVATTTEIENPLITKDNEERAAAQAIIDATSQEVIDAYNAL